MSVTTALRPIEHAALRAGLLIARSPITLAETVIRPAAGAEWPPALAFEAWEGTVKQAAGSILGDAALVEEGRLLAAKVDRLRHAATVEVLAEQRRESAAAEFQSRAEADERHEAEAARQAARRKATAADAAQKKRQAARAAEQRRTGQAKEREAEQVQAAQRKADAARLKSIKAEQQAVADRKAALANKKAAATRTKQLAAAKANRAG